MASVREQGGSLGAEKYDLPPQNNIQALWGEVCFRLFNLKGRWPLTGTSNTTNLSVESTCSGADIEANMSYKTYLAITLPASESAAGCARLVVTRLMRAPAERVASVGRL